MRYSLDTTFRRIITSLLLGILFTPTGLSQNHRLIDSLQQILNTTTAGKEQVDIYVRIASEYKFSDSTNTMKYALMASKLASQIGYPEGEIDALTQIAWINLTLSHFEEAERKFEAVFRESEAIGYMKGKAEGLNNLGAINMRLSRYESALDYYLQALTVGKEIGSKKEISISLNYIGNVYRSQNDLTKALEYYFEALELITDDKKMLANTYNNIAMVHDLQGNDEMALKYYHQSLEIEEELNYQVGVAGLNNNLGMINGRLGNYKEASEYAIKSLQIFEEMGVRAYMAYPILTLSDIYMAQGKWQIAKTYLEKGLALSTETDIKENIKFAAEGLARVEKELGNFKAAYEYHTLFKQMADSLQNKSQTEKITRIETEYKFQLEKDSIQFANQSTLLTIEKDRDKARITQKATIAIAFLLLALIIILFWTYRSTQRANKQISSQRDNLQQSYQELEQTQLKLVQSEKMASIVSLASGVAHEINNPLNFIQGSLEGIKKLKNKMSPELQGEVSELLNYSQEGVKRAAWIVSVLNEFNLSQNHSTGVSDVGKTFNDCLQILKLQTSEIEIQNNIQTNQYLVAGNRADLHIAFINILQNAIESIEGSGSICINAFVKGQDVKLTIKDNGCGICSDLIDRVTDPFFTTKPPHVGNGMGLAIALKCIQEHGGQLELASKEGEGTTVNICLPLILP